MHSMMDSEPKPKYFELKKWTLVTVLSLNVLVMVIFIFYTDTLIDVALKDYKDAEHENEDAKKTIKAVLIILMLIVIGLNFLFMYGVLKQNYCLSTTYAVLLVIATVRIIGSALIQPILWMWVDVFFGIIISAVAICYACDLRTMQRNADANQHIFHLV